MTLFPLGVWHRTMAFAFCLAATSWGLNLVANPGMENDLAGWQTVGTAAFGIERSQAHAGAKSGSITVTNPAYQQINQKFPVQAGDIFCASGWVRTLEVSSLPGAYLYLEFLDATGNRIRVFESEHVINSSLWWSYLHKDTVTAPAGATQLRIGCVLHAPGTAYFDEVSLERIGDTNSIPSLRVQFDTVIQSNFLGVNAVYHGFAYMPEQMGLGMDSTDRAREFGRVEAMGLNIARTWYRPDWAMRNTLQGPYNWNSPRMLAFYQWLQAMKDRQVDIALNLGWWFPDDAHPIPTDSSYTLDTARFSEWVSASLQELILRRGFTNIKYAVLFTEPTGYGDVLKGYASKWEYYVPLVRAVHHRLVQDGVRGLVKLVGPNNSTSKTLGSEDLDRAVADLNEVIDIYSGHDYSRVDYEDWYQAFDRMQQIVHTTGKPVWLDEYGYGKADGEALRQTPEYGNYLAQVVAASINAGLQTSLLWILFDQQYVSPLDAAAGSDGWHHGVQRWGLCKWPHDSTQTNPDEPYPSWYAHSLLSRYLPGRGSLVYKTTKDAGVILSAIKTSSGDYSFLVINKNHRATPYRLTFSASLDKSLAKYGYDPAVIQVNVAATLLGSTKTFPWVANTLLDTIPARGVTILSSIGTSPAARQPSPKPGIAYRRTPHGISVFAPETQVQLFQLDGTLIPGMQYGSEWIFVTGYRGILLLQTHRENVAQREKLLRF